MQRASKGTRNLGLFHLWPLLPPFQLLLRKLWGPWLRLCLGGWPKGNSPSILPALEMINAAGEGAGAS